MRENKADTVDAGSGDVPVDLGFADAGERKLRVELAMRLNELIAARRLTQAQAARLFGIPQPHVSELKPEVRLMVQPARRSAAKTRLALVEGQEVKRR